MYLKVTARLLEIGYRAALLPLLLGLASFLRTLAWSRPRMLFHGDPARVGLDAGDAHCPYLEANLIIKVCYLHG